MAPKKDTAVVPAPATALAEFNPRDPQTILAAANQLQQFITDNRLASTIQGRAYVQCEGWQFLFAVAGLDVVCEKPQRLLRDGEICYEAEARLFDAEGRTVGYGYALCADTERTKKGWAEYAIASMAQTRAIGKAGRNRFAFVMKAAGFEPTPAEEMSEVGTSATVVTQPAPAVTMPAAQDALPVATAADWRTTLESATSTAELKELWSKVPGTYAAELQGVKDAQKALIDEKVAADAAGMSVEQYRQQPTP